jgi:FKBP-type peptidyl-prolyl cis-trans isomerase
VTVDRKKMLQVLIPAVGAAAVVLLVAILISMGDTTSSPTGRSKTVAPIDQPARVEDLTKFPNFSLTGPEWKPVDEAVYPGLKYWDVKEGAGEACPKGATVTIDYTGWLVDGTKFDSGKHTFPLGNLIQGWQAGIPGMKPGGVRRLLIPSDLGYGPHGRGQIPANATLVFEIEMISFKS